ncbi:SDR family NAD(P)-dependent oxidoreductase, partial [Patescibacteria group bacterium]|nr:SDR family NAD(P)-dependent oxidoreductase [Patescibacteria group bacterium]
MTKPSALQPKPLSQSNVVVTGGSRDIGGGIVLELSKAGAKVSAVFRSHADRAQKIIEEAKKSGAPEPLPIQADLTTNDGRKAVFNSWKKNFADNID